MTSIHRPEPPDSTTVMRPRSPVLYTVLAALGPLGLPLLPDAMRGSLAELLVAAALVLVFLGVVHVMGSPVQITGKLSVDKNGMALGERIVIRSARLAFATISHAPGSPTLEATLKGPRLGLHALRLTVTGPSEFLSEAICLWECDGRRSFSVPLRPSSFADGSATGRIAFIGMIGGASAAAILIGPRSCLSVVALYVLVSSWSDSIRLDPTKGIVIRRLLRQQHISYAEVSCVQVGASGKTLSLHVGTKTLALAPLDVAATALARLIAERSHVAIAEA